MMTIESDMVILLLRRDALVVRTCSLCKGKKLFWTVRGAGGDCLCAKRRGRGGVWAVGMGWVVYAGGRIGYGYGEGTCFVTGHGVRRSISFKIKIIEAAEHKTL